MRQSQWICSILLLVTLAGCGAPATRVTVKAAENHPLVAQSTLLLSTRAEWIGGPNGTGNLALGVGGPTLLGGGHTTDDRGGTPIRIGDREVARGNIYPTPDGKLYLWDHTAFAPLDEYRYYFLGTLEETPLATLEFGQKLRVKWAQDVSYFAEAKSFNPMIRKKSFWLILKEMPPVSTVEPQRVTRNKI